ncbi:MAG: hypothetical protein K2X01_12035 [Cyanobacteria bacterium]|nr:hypothetical protein [Cyanobacteriota bacterium]
MVLSSVSSVKPTMQQPVHFKGKFIPPPPPAIVQVDKTAGSRGNGITFTVPIGTQTTLRAPEQVVRPIVSVSADETIRTKNKKKDLTGWRALVFPRSLRQMVVNVVMGLGLAGGGAFLASYDPGDGQMPTLNYLERVAPNLLNAAQENTTGRFIEGENFSGKKRGLSHSADEYWKGLQPSLELLNAVSPEIHSWVVSQYNNGKLLFSADEVDELKDHRELGEATEEQACFNYKTGELPLLRTFWSLKDGEKAAFFIHEYRHYRQNMVKRVRITVNQVVTGKSSNNYLNPLEDEAYLYQQEALMALGMKPSGDGMMVRYLQARGYFNRGQQAPDAQERVHHELLVTKLDYNPYPLGSPERAARDREIERMKRERGLSGESKPASTEDTNPSPINWDNPTQSPSARLAQDSPH